MQRTLTNKDIGEINPNEKAKWDGIDRRKGNSVVPSEMERRYKQLKSYKSKLVWSK